MMKRWGVVGVAAVIATTAALVKIAAGNRRDAPGPAATQAVVERRTPAPVRPGLVPPVALTSPAGDDHSAPAPVWKRKAAEAANLGETLRQSAIEDTEAAAVRMKLSDDETEKLVRWRGRVVDRRISLFRSVGSEHALAQAEDRAAILSEAATRAEIRLLGGIERWNAFNRLRSAAMAGYLDRVDDHGEFPRAPGAREPGDLISSGHSRGRGRVDTSEFDPLFQ